MEAVQTPKIHSDKQKLLEFRMTSTGPPNIDSNSNGSDIEIIQPPILRDNQSNSETIPYNNYDCLSDSIKFDDNSLSSTYLINVVTDSKADVVTETVCKVQNDFIKPISNNVMQSVNEILPIKTQISQIKRPRKSKIDSPNGKKMCNRTENRIDHIFKSRQPSIIANPCKNSSSDGSLEANQTTYPPIQFTGSSPINPPMTPASSSRISFKNNSMISLRTTIANQKTPSNKNTSNNNQDDAIIFGLKVKIDDLEQQHGELNRENEALKNYSNIDRENLIESLIKESRAERRSIRERVNNSKLQIGQFKTYRQGAHYDEKWMDGEKYRELEEKKKRNEDERVKNEKDKKLLNKRKASEKTKQNEQRGPSDVDSKELFWEAEMYDNRKRRLNQEEKDLQTETERLDRERNLHIREIKRIDCEDASRFKDFPILNERYLLLCLLGKGGFSEVHKGYDLEQRCFVACKIHELNPRWTDEKKDSYMKHAMREISIHKSLDHKRIVRVHDVFNIDNDAICTVLEYCEANDLDFYLKQNKTIPEKEAKSLIFQLVSALRYMNDRKNPIIHYDLKPGNILLCNNEEIKVTDFGLSKILSDDNRNTEEIELTSQGAGTYWYLPPECFATESGPITISNKVDVWSVGVIFFQCLYGVKPFGHNMTQTDILHNHTILQARNIVFPLLPKVSDAVKDFIRKCCTYNKVLRPDVFKIYEDDYFEPKSLIR